MGAAGGKLQDWIQVLPKSFIPVIVVSAVRYGILGLNLKGDVLHGLKHILTHAVDQANISTLAMQTDEECTLKKCTTQALQRVSAMTQLKRLILWNVQPPDISNSTTLTLLRLDSRHLADQRQTLNLNIRGLTALQVHSRCLCTVPEARVLLQSLKYCCAC